MPKVLLVIGNWLQGIHYFPSISLYTGNYSMFPVVGLGPSYGKRCICMMSGVEREDHVAGSDLLDVTSEAQEDKRSALLLPAQVRKKKEHLATE
ncbi:hypothetical protein Y1Q_0002071 [Alligator mississippiensis]|uniref:Uncharacterized protein n=1 Tax=Alligator mississippiensis TaxID=8496 RepID=A0A151MJ83_ALLMI|nr:hypothetical protein Y1Q_0002071 [Alligator mississippiensis]